MCPPILDSQHQKSKIRKPSSLAGGERFKTSARSRGGGQSSKNNQKCAADGTSRQIRVFDKILRDSKKELKLTNPYTPLAERKTEGEDRIERGRGGKDK